MSRRTFLRLLALLAAGRLMPSLGFLGNALVAKTVRSLSTVGYWNQIAEPRCAYYNGQTYIAFVRDTGHVYAMAYAHGAGTTTSPHDFGATTSVDGAIHNAPCIIVRDSDKRPMWAQVSDDTSAQPAYAFTTNPEDATSWGSTNLIAPSKVNPTYPIVAQLKTVTNQPIYYFDRINLSGTYYTGFYKSTDGGSTWAAFQQLLKPVTTSSQYHTIFTNQGDRIDIFTTDTNRALATPSSVYHMYLLADNLYKSDGTLIGPASGGPYFANTGTLVKNASEGPARTDGWAYDAFGRPCGLVVVNSGGTTSLIRTAVWNGTSWDLSNVVDSNGIIDSNVFQSSGAMVHSDPYTLFVPKKVGSYFELFSYVSTDAGASWVGTALTTSSGADNALPACPLNAGAGVDVVWARGTYTSDSSFSMTLYVYG